MTDTSMPPPLVENPRYWLRRADKARKLAASGKEGHSKAVLLNLAEQYEWLATLSEQRRKSVGAS